MKISSKTYDVLKWLFSVFLPALTALYLTLSNIWGWPYSEAIGASAAAVIAFGCTILGISSINYHKQLKKKEGVNNGQN